MLHCTWPPSSRRPPEATRDPRSDRCGARASRSSSPSTTLAGLPIRRPRIWISSRHRAAIPFMSGSHLKRATSSIPPFRPRLRQTILTRTGPERSYWAVWKTCSHSTLTSRSCRAMTYSRRSLGKRISRGSPSSSKVHPLISWPATMTDAEVFDSAVLTNSDQTKTTGVQFRA